MCQNGNFCLLLLIDHYSLNYIITGVKTLGQHMVESVMFEF